MGCLVEQMQAGTLGRLTHSWPPTVKRSLAMGSPSPMPFTRLYPMMVCSCSPAAHAPKIARHQSGARTALRWSRANLPEQNILAQQQACMQPLDRHGVLASI